MKYPDYIRRSIATGDPEKWLAQIYGYESYEALRWDSMSLSEKLSEKSGQVFRRVKRTVVETDSATMLFGLLALAFPFFLIYMAAAENIFRMKALKTEFATAEKLDRDGVMDKALVMYRSFLGNLDKARKWERRWISAEAKMALAKTRLRFLQTNLLAGRIREIERTRTENAAKAEALCFAFDGATALLFDDEFARQAKSYLDKNAPAIISAAGQTRDIFLEDICSQKRHLEAVQSCLDYALQRQTSRYYPAQKVDSQITRLIESFLNSYDGMRPSLEVHNDAKRIMAIAAKLKPHRALAAPFAWLHRLAEQLVSHARMRAIQEIIGAQEMFREEETEPFSDELPEPEKQCAVCGEEVKNGLMKCPNGGSENFSMK